MSSAVAARRTPGVVDAVAGTDHKRIGLNMAAASLAFFVGGGVLALVMRLELAQPGMQFVSHGSYDALFTMHGSTMIYLFVMPIALAAGLYLVPLQVGAAEVQWPRLALAGFWLWLGGGLIMHSGWLTAAGPGRAGWFSYVPLSDAVNTPGQGMDLWVVGVALAGIGPTLVAISILGTIVRRRAPGMTMLRMPFFTWTMLVTVLMVLTSFPALVLVMVLLFLDRQGVGIFQGFTGAIDYQNIFWFFGHPVVYVMFFPFVGMVAEAFAVNARRRFFGYRMGVLSLLVFTSLSMAVWAHHMYATGGVANRYFGLTSTLLLVPAGVEYFDLMGTLMGGAIVMRTSLLFGVGFLLQFLIGGLSGIFVASPPLDYNVTDTYVVVAHFHYTLMAGSVFGLFAGIYHWFGKATGALLREGLGKVNFALMFVGTNLTFLPMFVLGHDGMRRRIADYPAAEGWGTLNTLETVGSFLIAASVAVFCWNVWTSLRRRVPAGPDPWGGQTLEWATTSPPPRWNFPGALPPVRSYAPLLDLPDEVRARLPGGARRRAELAP